MSRYSRVKFCLSAIIPSVLMLGLGLLPARQANADVVFSFNFTDLAGIGFNAAGQTGIDRRAGLGQAASYISSLLVNYNATILIDVNGGVTNDTTLASASSKTTLSYPGDGFGTRGDVMTKILGGADPSPGTPDGDINWNFEDFNWEPLSDFQPGELDLISTAIHELTHTLGFGASIAENGDSPWAQPAGTSAAWAPFAQFLTDSTNVPLIDGTTFALDGARWDAAKIGGPNNGLFFNGANAMAAFGGNSVPLYSPVVYLSGSTASHTDSDFFTGGNEQLMNHASSLSEGLDIRTLSAIEMGILRDIGYSRLGGSAAVVPEPGEWAVMGMAALSVGGLMLKARRKRSS